MEREIVNKEIRFIPKCFFSGEPEDHKFYFLAEKDIEWKEKKVRQFTIYPKIPHDLFREKVLQERDKKKFLAGGRAIVVFFVAVVLVFRGIYQKKKKNNLKVII